MTPATLAIRNAFQRSGLTQAQVAARAGVSERTVWTVLAGHPVGMRALFAICVALDVSHLPVSELPARFCENPRT